MKKKLGFRHIHLDFHTSEFIDKIGVDFSCGQFADTLTAAAVDSITLFSKCHHGYSYHPTTIGKMHPHLSFNLLAKQIEACKKAGVRYRIYLSAGLDEYFRKNNPGREFVPMSGSEPLAVRFKHLCFNTDYLDYLCLQIEEAVRLFDSDGIFLDIVAPFPCVCQKCQNDMFTAGLDPQNADDVNLFSRLTLDNYFKRTMAASRLADPELPIFQNAGHITKGDNNFLKYVSHLEIESLPTGGWGYDHFPASAKYAAKVGVDFLGMTGKFHTTWGEFGGFKKPAALVYETSLSVAFGAKCSIGDQLHPSGKLNPDTYSIIGSAFEKVRAKERFCENAQSVAQIALLPVEALQTKAQGKAVSSQDHFKSDVGALRMLLEKQMLFDVIDADMDLMPYRLIIIPDECCIDPATADKLQSYIDNGGRLLVSYQAALKPGTDELYFGLGKYKGVSQFNPTYIQVTDETFSNSNGLIRSPFVAYKEAVDIDTDGKVLAHRLNPYFNRTLEHFCSHQHYPENGISQYPAVFVKNNVCCFTNRIFAAYADHGQMLYRDLFAKIAGDMLGGLMFESNLQSAGRVSLMRQRDMSRYILHLLYVIPIKRGDKPIPNYSVTNIEVIEDINPVYDVKCKLLIDEKIKSASLEPCGVSVPFEQLGKEVRFTVEKVECHQMVVLNY